MIIYLFTFIINPYGIDGALHPWKVFFLPNYINFYKYSNIIAEMQSPAYLFSPDGICFFIWAALGILAITFVRKNKLLLIILFSVSLAFFLYSQRNSDFFILISAYIDRKSVV